MSCAQTTYKPAFTVEALQALEAALAEGVQRVKYTDKEVEYRTVDEMIKLRNLMLKVLGLSGCNKNRTGLFGGKRINAVYSKGLDDC